MGYHEREGKKVGYMIVAIAISIVLTLATGWIGLLIPSLLFTVPFSVFLAEEKIKEIDNNKDK